LCSSSSAWTFNNSSLTFFVLLTWKSSPSFCLWLDRIKNTNFILVICRENKHFFPTLFVFTHVLVLVL
jgi:hypothetical protein